MTATPRAEEMAAVGDVTRLLAAAWTAARVAEGLVAIGPAPGAAPCSRRLRDGEATLDVDASCLEPYR